ncbi:hypothetical protein ACU635_39905 [[Actinomadura] parvosata]
MLPGSSVSTRGPATYGAAPGGTRCTHAQATSAASAGIGGRSRYVCP